MGLPKLQNPFDWATQLGHMILGRKADHGNDAWLLGPIGKIGEKSNAFVARIAEEGNLEVERNKSGVGLVDEFDDFDFPLNPNVESFYTRTSDFELDAWTEWKPFFKPFGFLVGVIFSKRIQQLYLPMHSLETAEGISSSIISLLDQNESSVYRIWHRQLKTTKNVIFYGIYSKCQLPSGAPGIKTIFPLPQGSATAIFEMNVTETGSLLLTSEGKTQGDPGFYVIIEDHKGQIFKHFMPYFRQRIEVYEDAEGTIRANHTMSLWSFRVHNMHYKIVEKRR